MKWTSNIGIAAVAALCGSSAFAQSASFDGIWQDVRDSGSYVSIQVNGARMVLVDLASLARSGVTLQSSYIGEITQGGTGAPSASVAVLDDKGAMPMHKSATVVAVSANEIAVYWCSQLDNACVIGVVQSLRKVF